jgi:hypothetical protein
MIETGAAVLLILRGLAKRTSRRIEARVSLCPVSRGL